MIKVGGSPTQRQGRQYEDLVCAHLQRAGLQLLDRNFHTRCGEIDLVLREQQTLVFVEVRFRRSIRYGSPVASVNPAKQRKIRQAAKLYLLMKGLYEKVPCRFDVVGVTPEQDKLACRWIKNAFQ